MARVTEQLSALKVKRARKPGYYGDGGGLYLQVSDFGTKSWVFRYASPTQFYGPEHKLAGQRKPRELGIGAAGDLGVSLATAREVAQKNRDLVAKGIDPVDAKRAGKAATAVAAAKLVTFKEAAEAYVEKKRGKWRSGKHTDQWLNTLTAYAFPLIGGLPVQAIDTGLIVKILEAKQEDGKSLWDSKPSTASRLLGRIESILGAATVAGHRTGDNPARWNGHLEEIFSGKAASKPQPKLPYAEVPAFMVDLAAQPGDAKKALKLTILCDTRSNETAKARIGEIDFAAKVWTIPADRTKRAREFRVPLTDAAIEILREFCEGRNDPRGFVFQGRDLRKSMSSGAMLELVKRMHKAEVDAGRKGYIDPKQLDEQGNPKRIVVHGFRGSFRDWAGASGIPRELAELCMNHRIGDATEQAYFTDDLLERRRNVMKAWAAYALGEAPGKNVVTLERETA